MAEPQPQRGPEWLLIRPEHAPDMQREPRKYGVAWKHEAMAQCSRAIALTAECDQLRNALIGLVGASEPEELRAMEAAIQALPVPADDSAVILTAIRALLPDPAPEGNSNADS